MTEIEVLRKRKELVTLSAELQRTTIARRLSRIDSNPARVALGYAAKVASRPVLVTLGTRAVRLALRAYRRRSEKKGRH
ncbi:MAG TPA: hypothetical protein VLY46_01540 [Usitatibacter sp.]|nr:hypothetical protein [Usitatibacter sp.]